MNIDGLSLTDLLAGLNKQAADQEEDEKKEKSESKKDEKDEDNKPAFLKSKGEKSDDDEENEDKEKKASLAQEILQKTASINSTVNSEENMTKTAAQLKGEQMAAAMLEKLASAGDTTTVDGVAPGTVPHKTIVDLATQVKEDDAKIQGQPGAGGTINNIFDAVVADALAQGAAPLETVGAGTYSAAEGKAESAIPNQVKTAAEQDNLEKAAAVSHLVQTGYDFADAVDMVKAAEEEIEAEEEEQVKVAAFNSLRQQGVSFDDAVALVSMTKEAGAMTTIGGKLASVGKKGMSTGAKIGLAAGAGAAAGGAAFAATKGKKEQEKKAAFDQLMQAGLDPFEAANLVNQKADELYGA